MFNHYIFYDLLIYYLMDERASCLLWLVNCRTEERAAGWIRLTREILKLPEAPSVSANDSKFQPKDALPPKPSSEKVSKSRRPQPLIKLVMRRCMMFPSLFFLLFLLFIFLLSRCHLHFVSDIILFPLDWRALFVVSLVLCFMQQQELFRKWEEAGQQHIH